MDQTTGSGLALEYDLMKQPKYRVYISNIDKALKNFEGSCSEWADLISALGKLNKVISSYPQYDIIPRRIKISKRLAQCMHPNLPSGVHLKALETYSIIFQNAGVERLASELFIYSAGLFPLFGYAAMNVRPALLDIYETHFVKLGERLRPALSGFLSGVLPGLEVGMDHYKRTNMLMEQVCAAVSPPYFYTCVWECVVTNSAIRLPAVTYVLDHFSRKMPMQEQRYILGENVDLTVSALCSCLNDPVILVQRNTLELLLIGFPMHNSVLTPADTIKLVTHGLNTILRRDMSLNRRLYSWLLGTEVKQRTITNGSDSNEAHHQNYFSQYSMQVLIKAYNATLKLSLQSKPADLRPYKILISLLDKVEIGPVVLDDVLCNVIRTMYLSRADQDVQKQANLLFSTFDASYIWDFMTHLYSKTCVITSEESLNLTDMLNRKESEVRVDSGPPSLKEVCKLTEFLLETVSLEIYNETTRVYLPRVLLAITKMLTIYSECLIDDEVMASLNLMQKIVTRVQPMITGPARPVVMERENKDEKPVLEKSKSDSKLNQIEDDTTLKKSSSQSKIPKSPKKTKKSKSYSKLTELDKDPLDIVCTDTGQLVNSTPNLDEKLPGIPEKDNFDQKTEMTMPEYSILEKCIKQYEIFFQVYISGKVLRVENRSGVTVKVLSAQESIEKSKFLNEDLVADENQNRTDAIDLIFSTLELEAECRVAKLKDLLNACISRRKSDPENTAAPTSKDDENARRKTKQTDAIVGQLLSQRLSDPFRDSLKLACNLLVDMSTFPNYNQELVYDETELAPPPWLKSLAIIACYLCCDKDMQISVISILFELISLLKPAGGRHSSAPGVTSVVMLPLMERGHLNYMTLRTRIFQILISSLWDYLGDPIVDNSGITKLLYQLHSCLSTGIVEQVVGNRLANTHLIWSTDILESIRTNARGNEGLLAYTDARLRDLVICKPIIPQQTDQLTEKQGEGFKKFELLWHLAPTQESECGFEKLQMRMYDSLTLPLPIRSMVIKWLQDSLMRGDIGNLLKPLFKVLLALQTRRISLIQIASRNEDAPSSKLDKTLQQYDMLSEKDLYAVSTEPSSSGVRYRTEAIPKKKSPRGIRIFGVPLNPIKSKTPSLENVKKFISSSKTPEDPNISLIVNPLELSSDLDTTEVDEFGLPLSSSAPTKHDYLESQSTGELSRKKVDISDTDSISTESEVSELPPYSSLPETTKRYSGNCEHVEEKISAFDKIKNRKTYKLMKHEEVSLCRGDSDDKSLAEMSIRIRQTEMDDTTTLNDSITENEEEHNEDKRLSCSSKNSSSSGGSSSGGDQKENEEMRSLDEELANMDPKGKLEIKSKTPEARRRGQITTEMNWEKTKEKFEKSKLNLEILRQSLIEDNLKLDKIDPYHTHIFLYLASYDTKQTLYAFQTLRNIIAVDTRMFVCMSLTTSISSQVRQLLERHRRSIDGRESVEPDSAATAKKSSAESQYSFRGCMYFEALISICLSYGRSYFQRDILGGKPTKDTPSSDEISDNFKIQIESIDLLTTLLSELIAVVKEMGKNLNMSSYVADLMNKCRIPKVILHSIVTSVNAITNRASNKAIQFIISDSSDETLYAESIQLQLLKLLNAVIKLEFEVRAQLNDENFKDIVQGSPTRLLTNVPTNAKYLPGYTIPQQPMFMAAIITALQSEPLKHLHKNWISIITNCLNCYTGGSLTNIVINVVHQVCNNIDKLIQKPVTIPVDYAAAQMEALTTLCHYCLLDLNQQGSQALFNSNTSFSQGIQQISGQIVNNLVSALMASTSTFLAPKSNSHHIAARNAVLSHLPRIIGSAAGLWEHDLGQTRFVKQQLFDFLNPICLHHTSNFLAALAVAWHDRNNRSDQRRSSDGSPTLAKNYLPQATTDQLTIIKLITGIRAMRMDLFIRTLHDIIKTAPTIYNPPSGWSLEVSGLELFYFYMNDASATSLPDAWPSLLALLRDGLSSAPPALFVMCAILSVYVQRCPQMPFNDRKDLRDLHDITSKLVDAMSLIAGANLEQTTWLRRNLAVKEESGESSTNGLAHAQYSVQAQSIMACLLANLLDVAYGSQEKDKVATIVTTVMYNIVPYLKNHTPRNIPSFYACSNLLADLSGYQNTRKAWRKDVFELLTDPVFFQMDSTCLPCWKTILDNLMTYDNMAAFRDLMNRVSLTQTGGLNIFSSKEQEYEQRAMLLKRLAFVIFCSEFDQYHKYMPEIQEQLANSLRLPQMVPSVQAAVFLCFRVLLLRLSPDHVTSLWPTIIAEMVQVFLAIEQELMSDTDEFRINSSQHIRMLSALDTQWVTNSNNGLHAQNHPHWKMVQLETAKLLELGCVLPAVNLPHFQMYRWAFVRSQYDWDSPGMINGHSNLNTNFPVFVPHVTRIARLMDLRYTSHSPMQQQQRGQHLVLTCQTINNLQDLYGFFKTLSVRWPTQNVVGDQEKEVKMILAEVEQVLANDFLEPLPQTTLAR